MAEEQLREGERPGGSLGPRVLFIVLPVKITTFQRMYQKSLLINYPSPVLAMHMVFVYNSIVGSMTLRASERKFDSGMKRI